MSDRNNIVKFKKRKRINIGIMIFFILFLYIAINVYIYFTKDQLTIYEVQNGSTAVDNKITALILREEKLINSENTGYILFYQKDGARIAKASKIYSISDKPIFNTNNSDEKEIILSDKNKEEMKHEVSTFYNSFTNNNYEKLYDFQDTIQSILLDAENGTFVEEGQALEGAMKSQESGIITYYKDGYEEAAPEDVSPEMFKLDQYKKTNLRTTNRVSKNKSIYKIITSEVWNLVFPLTDELNSKLKDKKNVSFTILNSNLSMTANLRIEKKDSMSYAILTMDKNLSNYLGERYLDIKLNLEYINGLKIPNSSIIEKEFYKVPKEFFTQGGDSKEKGVNKVTYDNGETKVHHVPTDIYYEDNKFYYIDTQLFEAGTRIQSIKGADQYTLSKTMRLKGVYNVNQGYAVFKRIEMLYKEDEYTIIKENTANGISSYDHIALDGRKAVDQKIIY